MNTSRLTGRALGEGDVPFVMETWNDERVTALVRERMTEQQVRDRIERWRRHRANYGYATELFHDSSTARPIGWGGLQHSTIGIEERLTVGYAVRPDLWGRGYATEIGLASVAYAFDRLRANDVGASILSTNTPSRSVAEKVGMSLECEVSHGDLVEVIYVMDRQAWSRSREQQSRDA
jgi:RimJ/RimL family protein N-acetyltransferase